jgi:hypothetical protein
MDRVAHATCLPLAHPAKFATFRHVVVGPDVHLEQGHGACPAREGSRSPATFQTLYAIRYVRIVAWKTRIMNSSVTAGSTHTFDIYSHYHTTTSNWIVHENIEYLM